MNICITGALGHIGSTLIRNKFLSFFDRVYLVDNLLTQRYVSLFNLPKGINYSFHELDILSDQLDPLVKDSDILIHLAAVTDAASSHKQISLVEKINKQGLKRIADLCAKYNCLLIFPSTTSVYGSQATVVDETCRELKPQSPYADSKLWGEKLLQSLGKKKKFKFIILRLGTIFGYSIGMRFHTAVNKFIWQAASGEEITVWKTAFNQKRPYCDLGDAINAMIYIIKKNIFNREIYNIVTLNLTVAEIINKIKRYIPKSRIRFVDSPIMNQLSYNVSNKKSLKDGFHYCGDLETSIKTTLQKIEYINSSHVKILL